MSRYLLLVLLNLPLISIGILGAITQYKMRKNSGRRFVGHLMVWLAILIGLILAQPIYEWLYNHELTQTEPLSLFDVVQITAIVITFYFVNRARMKVETLERRLHDLHQELSISRTDATSDSREK